MILLDLEGLATFQDPPLHLRGGHTLQLTVRMFSVFLPATVDASLAHLSLASITPFPPPLSKILTSCGPLPLDDCCATRWTVEQHSRQQPKRLPIIAFVVGCREHFRRAVGRMLSFGKHVHSSRRPSSCLFFGEDTVQVRSRQPDSSAATTLQPLRSSIRSTQSSRAPSSEDVSASALSRVGRAAKHPGDTCRFQGPVL